MLWLLEVIPTVAGSHSDMIVGSKRFRAVSESEKSEQDGHPEQGNTGMFWGKVDL